VRRRGVISVQEVETKRRSGLTVFFVRLVREKPLGVVGGVIVLILLFCGIFADFLAPQGMNEINIIDRFAGPSSKNLLGADQVGRDILSRLIYGARISLIVGLSATAITVLVASLIGVPSGYFGGTYDLVTQRLVDAWIAFPSLLILLTLISIMGRGMLQIILLIGILAGVGWSRVVRSAVIAIKENDYFLAAEAIGSTNARTIIRHIMPNIMAPLIIVFSVSVGGAILTEASLSFLGFGLPLDVPSWGGMLSGEGRRHMEVKPSLALYPGIALATVIYGVNMFGDAVRDLQDPRLRGG
jgi:peptide/nickel transport system permease protein